jgi:hypothetical protein
MPYNLIGPQQEMGYNECLPTLYTPTKYNELTKASIYDISFSTSWSTSFNELMLVIFNVFDMMLNYWSISLYVCPNTVPI